MPFSVPTTSSASSFRRRSVVHDAGTGRWSLCVGPANDADSALGATFQGDDRVKVPCVAVQGFPPAGGIGIDRVDTLRVGRGRSPSGGPRRQNLATAAVCPVEPVSAGERACMSRALRGLKTLAPVSLQVLNLRLTGRHRLVLQWGGAAGWNGRTASTRTGVRAWVCSGDAATGG